MAYQNFFMSGNNGRRISPAQISGKTVCGEFRMRNEGSSIQIVSVSGYETNKKGEIATHVVVHNADGDIVFEDTFTCKK